MASGTEHAHIPVATCRDHTTDEALYFCKTCHRRVCERCVKGSHSGHDWTNLKNHLKTLRMEGPKMAEKIRREVIASLKARRSRTNKEEEKAKIRHRQQMMKTELSGMIDEYGDNLVSQLDDDENGEDLDKEINEFEQLAVFFETHVRTEYDSVVVETEEELHAKLHQHKALETKVQRGVLRFKEGAINKDMIKSMMGQLENVMQDRSRSKSEVTVEKTIQHGSTKILGISTESEETAWIYSKGSQGTSLIDTDGKEIDAKNYKTAFACFLVNRDEQIFTHFGNKSIHRISGHNITRLGSTAPLHPIIQGDDQIFSHFGNKSIHRISGHNITEICSTAPLSPTGICHSRDGGMLVCLTDCHPDHITSSSKGEIHHMDMTGRIQRKYHKDESNHTKLFTFPYRVAQNINSDICVSDLLDKDSRGRLVVVTEDSRIRSTYTGQASLKETFTVSDVVCDPYGRIILIDRKNNAVHMLNAEGEFVQLLLTSESGLWGPTSLSLYRDSLWVGCLRGVIKVCKLKEQS